MVEIKPRKNREMIQLKRKWMLFSSGFLAFDNLPAIVPDNLIQAIRRPVDLPYEQVRLHKR